MLTAITSIAPVLTDSVFTEEDTTASTDTTTGPSTVRTPEESVITQVDIREDTSEDIRADIQADT